MSTDPSGLILYDLLGSGVFLMQLWIMFIFIACLLAVGHVKKWHWRRSIILSYLVFNIFRNYLFEMICQSMYIMSLFMKDKLIASKAFFTYFVYHCRLAIRFIFLLEKIDDRIDKIPAEHVLSFGEASLGSSLSPFLNSFVSQDEINLCNKFVVHGLITQKELNSFLNIFSNKLYLQAKLTCSYYALRDHQDKALIREKIAQENIEISGTLGAFMGHLILKDSRITTYVHQHTSHELTYDFLKEIYPTFTDSGELLQIIHDVTEFRYDLIQEPVIGKICPNYLLAQVEKKGLMVALANEIEHSPGRLLSYKQLPDFMQSIIFDIESMIRDRNTKIHFKFYWFWVKTVGFYDKKPYTAPV